MALQKAENMTIDEAVELALPVYRLYRDVGTLKEIAARAGVSRVTLYRRCLSSLETEKAGTPQSVPAHETTQAGSSSENYVTPLVPPCETATDMEEAS